MRRLLLFLLKVVAASSYWRSWWAFDEAFRQSKTLLRQAVEWPLTGRYFKCYIFLYIYRHHIYIYIYTLYIYIYKHYIYYIYTYIQSYRKILQKKHMKLTVKHPRWIVNSTKAKTQFSWNHTFEWTPYTFWNPSHTLRIPSHRNT